MTEISKLAVALVKAQADLKNPAMDAKNPHFKSKFASLLSVREAVLPVFNKHGLAIIQRGVPCENGIGINTVIIHESGEVFDAGTISTPVAKNDSQAYMSAVTYARRYGLQTAAGVCGDPDDDGNASAGRDKADVPAPKADKLDKETIAFLQAMSAHKKTLGEAIYRKILGVHGFESSKDIKDSATRQAVYKHMCQQVEENAKQAMGAK